jgi:hypothetical protein
LNQSRSGVRGGSRGGWIKMSGERGRGEKEEQKEQYSAKE